MTQLYASASLTPRRDPLFFISVSGRIETTAVVRPGILRQRKNSKIALFLLAILSDTPPQYYCFYWLFYQINPHNITVSADYSIRYTPTILLFLLAILSDTPPQYYCFYWLFYQIHPHNITVSVACPIRYTPIILLFLLTVLLDIPPQYYEYI